MLSEVEDIKKGMTQPISNWPVFLCGDYNTTPTDLLYGLITGTVSFPLSEESFNHFASCVLPDAAASPSMADIEAEMRTRIPEFVISIVNHGHFRSAYRNYRAIDKTHFAPDSLDISSMDFINEPYYTNYASWKGTLDYIMIGTSCDYTIDERQLLQIPDWKGLEPGLPNDAWPSDHVPIGVLCFISPNKV